MARSTRLLVGLAAATLVATTGSTSTMYAQDGSPPVSDDLAGIPGGPVARPPELPGRLPWAAGTSHSVRPVGADGPDGYGFDVVSGDRGDAIDEDTTVFPVFGGTVRHDGCATGASATLGRVVIIERAVDEHTYQAVYSHLSSVAPGLTTDVSANDPIGTFGNTATSSDGSCDGGSGEPRLHVALLRDAEVTPAGEVLGGQPVEPWPLLGAGIYEPLAWWQGPMEAIDIVEDAEVPTAAWGPRTTRDRKHVPFGRPVHVAVEASDDGGLRELRLLAMHDDWAQQGAGGFPEFDAASTWRVLAVCRPAGIIGVPGQTQDCEWDGDDRDATVAFRWRPKKAEQRGRAPWLPPADAAISRSDTRCVPVALAFEVVDSAGHHLVSTEGDVATSCGADASSLGRTVYLDPLEPPAEPTDARVRCTKRPEIKAYCLRNVLSWTHPAPRDVDFRIFLESVTWIAGSDGPCRYETQEGPWLLAIDPSSSMRWTVDYDKLNAVVEAAIGERARLATTHELAVAAFDSGGQSTRRKASGAVVYFNDDIPCDSSTLEGYGGS